MEQIRTQVSDFTSEEWQLLKSRVAGVNNRAKRLDIEGIITLDKWVEVLSASEGYCFYCQDHFELMDLEIEHVIPLARLGTNLIENIVVACSKCNLRKNRSTVEEWEQRIIEEEESEERFNQCPIKLRLKEVATAKGFSLSQLQRRSGLTMTMLRRYWYNRTSTVSLEALRVLSELLQVPPGDFFVEEQEEKKKL